MHGPDVHPVWRRLELTPPPYRAVLLDIEGTTTPIEFVHQVLFPYARARVRPFLRQHASDPAVRGDLALLAAERAAEPSDATGLPPWHTSDPLASAEAYVYWLMDRDRKSPALKSLQGRIWEAGYRAGELKGRAGEDMYPDVPPALARWHNEGKTVAIFSSGSVQAQRNLFANTTAGDLSKYVTGYFDTTTGPKRSADSYGRIAVALGRDPREVLFVSDVVAELDAARNAGMQTALCVRAAAPAAGGHRVIRRLDEL